MRKLYVQVGRVRFRPTLRIRDTGFSRNQWQRLGRTKSGAGFHGSEPVWATTVEEEVSGYFKYLIRCGAKAIWVEE